MLVSVLGIVDHLVHQKGSSKKISSNGSRNGRNSCGGTASPPRRRVQVKIPEPQFWLSAIHSVVASRRAASGTRPGATSANAMERAEWMAGDDDNIDDDDEGDPHYTIPTYASKVSCAANRKKAQQLQAKPKSKSGAKGCHYRHHSTAGMIGGKENNRAAYGGQADCHQHAEVNYHPSVSQQHPCATAPCVSACLSSLFYFFVSSFFLLICPPPPLDNIACLWNYPPPKAQSPTFVLFRFYNQHFASVVLTKLHLLCYFPSSLPSNDRCRSCRRHQSQMRHLTTC